MKSQSNSGASSSGPGCMLVAGVGVLCLAIFVVMLKSGASDGVALVISFIATGIATGLFMTVQVKKEKRAKEEARLRAIARAEAEAKEAEARREAEVREAEERRQQAYAEMKAAAARRYARLSSQYGEETANRIAAGRLWIGCTVEMLLEMRGPPEAMDEKVLKTKVKQTYKYGSMGANRYSLRVYIENDSVVGWEDKND